MAVASSSCACRLWLLVESSLSLESRSWQQGSAAWLPVELDGSVRERDQVARERKAAIGKLKRFDARGRGLELGLAGKRIAFRHRQRADARIGRRRIAPVNWREN